MQGEHPAQLKKNKMLTSAVLLPFGGFHKCPLLLPLGGSRLPAHNRGSAGPTWGSLSPKGSPWPNQLLQTPAEQGKSSFGKPKSQTQHQRKGWSRNCLLSTDLTFPHHRLQVMQHFVLFLVSFTLAKRKPRNCRKYRFIPQNPRDEEQQQQPWPGAGCAVSSADPDSEHQGNQHWAKPPWMKLLLIPKQRWNCHAEETCSVLTQSSSREPAEHNTDFSGKTSLQREKKTLIPLWKAASNAGFGILTRQYTKQMSTLLSPKRGQKGTRTIPLGKNSTLQLKP